MLFATQCLPDWSLSPVLTPWMLRNWMVFHAFIPIRGNLGVEAFLAMGRDRTGL